jgi:hypothetical protein
MRAAITGKSSETALNSVPNFKKKTKKHLAQDKCQNVGIGVFYLMALQKNHYVPIANLATGPYHCTRNVNTIRKLTHL